MGRWAPDARGRLETAAMQLYGERGFDNTTVAEIAERAGLTERTFFRYFVDKREVLFSGGPALQEFVITQIDAAPATRSPLDSVSDALQRYADVFFQDRRDRVLIRQSVIAANAELQERELIKLATLAASVAEALRRRGVAEPASKLAAEVAVAAFRIAFETWTTGPGTETLSACIAASIEELGRITAREPVGPHGTTGQ